MRCDRVVGAASANAQYAQCILCNVESIHMSRSMYMYAIYMVGRMSSIMFVVPCFEQPDSVIVNAIEQYAYADKVERDHHVG